MTVHSTDWLTLLVAASPTNEVRILKNMSRTWKLSFKLRITSCLAEIAVVIRKTCCLSYTQLKVTSVEGICLPSLTIKTSKKNCYSVRQAWPLHTRFIHCMSFFSRQVKMKKKSFELFIRPFMLLVYVFATQYCDLGDMLLRGFNKKLIHVNESNLEYYFWASWAVRLVLESRSSSRVTTMSRPIAWTISLGE